MTEQEIDALYAHAGKLVAERKSLSGVFDRLSDIGEWKVFSPPLEAVPNFKDGNEWRIAKPKKQAIDWSHEYFKWCATNYGALEVHGVNCAFTSRCEWRIFKALRLATPAGKHANWRPFFSTPENDAKLRELAKMVRVEVRHAGIDRPYMTSSFDCVIAPKEENVLDFPDICNYRITGKCQDGWTDNPEDAA